MPYASSSGDTSADALAELRGTLDDRDDVEIATIEDRLHAHAFAQQCAREWDEKNRLDRAEHITTEALEVVASVTAGALSTWKSGMVPLGAIANSLIGVGAKAGSIWNPEGRALRVTCKTGKVLLHSQIAIIARTLITGTP